MSNKYLEMDLLRFTTAGSVDDGKSTLMEDYYMTVNPFFKIKWMPLKRPVKRKEKKR